MFLYHCFFYRCSSCQLLSVLLMQAAVPFLGWLVVWHMNVVVHFQICTALLSHCNFLKAAWAAPTNKHFFKSELGTCCHWSNVMAWGMHWRHNGSVNMLYSFMQVFCFCESPDEMSTLSLVPMFPTVCFEVNLAREQNGLFSCKNITYIQQGKWHGYCTDPAMVQSHTEHQKKITEDAVN